MFWTQYPGSVVPLAMFYNYLGRFWMKIYTAIRSLLREEQKAYVSGSEIWRRGAWRSYRLKIFFQFVFRKHSGKCWRCWRCTTASSSPPPLPASAFPSSPTIGRCFSLIPNMVRLFSHPHSCSSGNLFNFLTCLTHSHKLNGKAWSPQFPGISST